ncbi:MAG TPA: hypothetical protein VGF38_20035 [Ktedonobacterales bacterium]|jgi:hypothetical protein
MSDSQPHRRPALKLTSKWTPAFNADDMTAYLQGAPECSLGPTLFGEPPTVESVEFVTCKELTDRIKVYIGPDDDALVCYVVLRGPFNLTMISLPPGHLPGPHISQTVEEIYDASTGRLLVSGAGSSRPRPGD